MLLLRDRFCICTCCLGGWFLQAELFLPSHANRRGDFFPLSHNEPLPSGPSPSTFGADVWSTTALCPAVIQVYHWTAACLSLGVSRAISPSVSRGVYWHNFICMYLLLTLGCFCSLVISFSPSADKSISQGSQNRQTLPVHCFKYCLQI